MVLRDRVLALYLCCLFFVCVGEVQGVTKLLGLKQLCCWFLVLRRIFGSIPALFL
jgi:hypothetical protein